ncbi:MULTISPECIES: hypothetical protein [Flammeovirga]|uniref:YD repeat-containing protein n=1 Tax=Flammeovirga agarivorans TaxID=2726742 RepID=A0A7X8SLB4_9BACT|nr:MULTISPECIES: hypothetical protein [Flammeovirga]NLR92349.1 hypothetical protein [Flammeovirga agarivorans]
MLKLKNTLFILFIAVFVFSCSDDEDSGPNYNTSPVAADCKLSSYVYSASVDSSDVNFQDFVNRKTYTYQEEQLVSYSDQINYSFLDTTGNTQSIEQEVEYSFEYSGNELTRVLIGSDEILSVTYLDGKPHMLSAEAVDGSVLEFVFGYDEQNRIKYIYNREDENSDIEEVDHYEFSYNGDSDVLEFSYIEDGLAVLINDYQYENTMRNPMQGLVFYIISIFETSFQNDGFFFGDASRFSSSITKFYRVSIYNINSEAYERSSYIEGDYSEDMDYDKNENNYPTSGVYNYNISEGTSVAISETFGYTNCQ